MFLPENKLSASNAAQMRKSAQLSIFTDGTQRNRRYVHLLKYSIEWKKHDLYIVHWNLTLTLWNLAS